MGWKLELVGTGSASAARRIEVARLGEIVAPASVEDIGLDHGTAQRMLGDIQRAVVALQEAALRAKADRLRRLDPTLRLKDYRLRTIQSLHGTLTIHVPRLARIGRANPAPVGPEAGYFGVNQQRMGRLSGKYRARRDPIPTKLATKPE